MSRISTASAPMPSVATAGWPPCRSPTPKPLGQDHQPAGAQLDGVTNARGAADGTERTGGAIAPLIVFLFFHDGPSSGIPSVPVTTTYILFVRSTKLTFIKK
jgi:hypothetical protein